MQVAASVTSSVHEIGLRVWSRRLAQVLWYERPVRTRILVALVALSALISVLGGAATLFGIRNRIEAEFISPTALAEQYIIQTNRNFAADEQLLKTLPIALAMQLRHIRHLKVNVLDAEGNSVALQRSIDEPQPSASEVPRWFAALAGNVAEHREIPLTAGARRIGTVILNSDASDELAEVWQEAQHQGVVWLAANAVMIAAFYFILGRILQPLVTVSRGMADLGKGNYQVQIDPPRGPEFDAIIGSFNGLASALSAARAENGRLYRELITVQEDERRQIASELHDEAGPCLFGITTTAAAIEARISRGHHDEAAEISRQLAEIASIAGRLTALNRQIMKRLQPIALGKVTLGELIGDLVADFARRYRDVRFLNDLNIAPRSYGDVVDLTIYRCIQEGIVNALRHGKARCVNVELSDVAPSADAAPTALLLVLRDDGQGIAAAATPGFGLAVMRERVQSLGGVWELSQNWPCGVTITATLPLSWPRPTAANRRL
ncbi:histidine kinase [Rhodopseudomonas palustris]|uniref:Putative signal transduction histidine kinase n=1 Tax=Rhodopseudomonas palustris (strain BisB18) TaxID=316056 RepID=Q217H4_RHOPB